MAIHYKPEQYRQITPTAFTFWTHCRLRRLVYKNKNVGPIGHGKMCLTYCPANDTYHLYDINRRVLILFKQIKESSIIKAACEHITINGVNFEWSLSNNSYKEGTSTVILMYDGRVQDIWDETEWDLTELRQIMSKNFIYPLIQFNR